MDNNSESSRRHDEEPEFNLREWHLKARRVNTTNSRRYSASYVGNTTIREEDNMNSRSFRSNFTISSTASSPGYNHLRDDEIDPSTYSFTTALKALQGRSAGYLSECLSPAEGFALNSKWDEAERYICNPLSGQVPMECLSTKTLSGRSFHSLVTNSITMSNPVVYSATKPRPRSLKPPAAPSILFNDNINNKINEDQHDKGHVPTTPTAQVERKGMIASKTRDVGTQSSPPPYHQSSSSSPATSPFSTPSFKERSSLQRLVRHEEKDEHGRVSTSWTNIHPSLEQVKLNEKDETRKEDEVGKGEDQAKRNNMQVQKVKTEKHCRCRQYAGCLLSFKNLWMRKRQTQKHKSKSITAIFFHHCLNIAEY